MGWALGIAFALTVLVFAIELPYQAKASYCACLTTGRAYSYLGISAIGNTLATTLAYPMLATEIPSSLAQWHPFFAGVAGVFAFKAVLSNVNITFLKHDLLTIDTWTSLARASAIEAVGQRQSDLDDATVTRMAADFSPS